MPRWWLWGRNARIARDAAYWHTEMLEAPSAETQANFDAWRTADPAHERAYREVEPFSALGSRLASPVRRAPRASTFMKPAFGVVIVALCIMGGLLLFVVRGASPAYAEVSNSGRAVRTVRLADGTIVALDRNTSLSVLITQGSRRIRFQSGRARFDVANDPATPFVVELRGGTVRSTGSEFDLVADADGMRVIALRGTASLSSSDAPQASDIGLVAGQAMRFYDGKLAPISISRDERLWPASRMAFDNTPLADVIAAANKIGTPPIRFASAEIGRLRVTAVLDLRDTRALARKLSATFGLKVSATPDAIRLARVPS